MKKLLGLVIILTVLVGSCVSCSSEIEIESTDCSNIEVYESESGNMLFIDGEYIQHLED